jgi:glycosyltransferase involved in cell wall biosynthesis
MKRLAIVTTHPIQYNAPLFRLLTQRKKIDVKVFYTWSQSSNGLIYDPGFGIEKKWDIPLLDGYNFYFSFNSSKEPGSHKFSGIINPYLISELKNYNPDAILVYGWSFDSHLKVLRYFKKKVPIYFRGDSTLISGMSGNKVKRLLRQLALKWVYSHIDFALYTGRLNKEYFMKHGLKDSQLIFMPHAVDNERFSAANKGSSLNFDLKQLGIGYNDKIFLYAGKFERVKNLELLITAFLEVGDPTAHLILVGSGELETRLKALSKNSRNTHYIPFQNQGYMPLIYRLADVYVLPSLNETWGLSVNEAMCSSSAILVSDRCGCSPDLVHENRNGFIFKASSKADLKAKLSTLSALSKSELQEYGKHSLQIIQEWSFANCAEILERNITSS